MTKMRTARIVGTGESEDKLIRTYKITNKPRCDSRVDEGDCQLTLDAERKGGLSAGFQGVFLKKGGKSKLKTDLSRCLDVPQGHADYVKGLS